MTSDFDTNDKITILLHEYDSLRSEVVQRYIGAFQLGVGGSTALAAFGAWRLLVNDYTSIVLVALGFVVLAFVIWQMERDTRRIAAHLRLLEADINKRAGEQLLTWETHFALKGPLARRFEITDKRTRQVDD